MATYDYFDKVTKGQETRKVRDSEAQRTGNLVSSFQLTPDNTHYPSEKLVKDQFDTKVNTSAMITNAQIDALFEG